MEPLRTRYRKSNLANVRLGRLNAQRRGCSQLDQNRVKPFQHLPTVPTGAALSIVDLLDVNGELSYTTIVEGLEELLYQQESQKYA